MTTFPGRYARFRGGPNATLHLVLALAMAGSACGSGGTRSVEMADDQRYVALPLAANVPNLSFCYASTTSTTTEGRMRIYGDADRPDPYAAPMVGVMWQPQDPDDDYPGFGDGERRDVTVRDTRGIVEELTVFQQAVVPDLGTALSWHEDGLSVTVVGRFWGLDEADELVSLAEDLQLQEGEFAWPGGPVPGYEQVFYGSTASLGIVVAPEVAYTVSYRPDDGDGTLIITGARRPPHDLEAVQLFTRPLEGERIGDRDALVGDAWFPGGPGIVTWQESDDLIVRIVAIGVDLDTVRAVAAQSRELTRAEWRELHEHDPEPCLGPGPAPPEPDDETDPTI